MAKTPGDDALLEPLKFKTWVLKVHIHCEGCRKTVKKALQSIEGVYKTEIDSQQHKATVVGNVDFNTLIKKLAKNGKHAELWAPEEYSSKNEQKSEKSKKNKNQKDPSNVENAAPGDDKKVLSEKSEDTAEDNDTKQASQLKDHPTQNNPDKTTAASDWLPEAETKTAAAAVDAQTGGGGGNGSKKKKNKGQNSNIPNVEVAGDEKGTENITLPPVKEPPILPMTAGLAGEAVNPAVLNQFGQPYQPQPAYYAAPEYGLSYNAAYPSINSSSFYSPPPMHSHAYFGPQSHPPPPPSDPIKPNSDHRDDYYDDDQSGCTIM